MTAWTFCWRHTPATSSQIKRWRDQRGSHTPCNLQPTPPHHQSDGNEGHAPYPPTCRRRTRSWRSGPVYATRSSTRSSAKTCSSGCGAGWTPGCRANRR
jgi:hypothetical protein